MGEAEKIDILSAPEAPAADKPETINLTDNFVQLAALIDRKGFDLRGKIKRSKSIDKQIKEEMLGYVDEALGVLTNFRREGASNKLANEAVDCFNILQEMGEKHILGFEKKQTEYNGKIEVEKSMPKEENQPIELVGKVSDPGQSEQREKPEDDKNKEAEEESLLAEQLEEPNNQKIMKNKIEEVSATRTMQEQLAAKKDAIEKVIVSGNPDNSASNQIEAEQKAEEAVAEKAVEVKKEEVTEEASSKKDVKQAMAGGNVKNPKKEQIKIVDVAGEQRRASEEKIMELEQKLKGAYEKSKNPKHRHELTKPVKDEIFKMIQEQYPGWTGKSGEDRVSGEVMKIIKKVESQIQIEEKERREREKEKKEKWEELKKQVEGSYKSLYEDYTNKGIPVPKEKSKLIDGLKENLRGIWPLWLKDKEGKPIRTGDFIEELKGKYRIETKKEEVAEAVKKEDSPEAKPAAATIEKPVMADEPMEKPTEKKVRPQSIGRSRIIIEKDFSSARNESQQKEARKIMEEIKREKEDKKRFEDIQKKIEKGKLINAANVKFALDYAVREQKRRLETEKKAAAGIKAEEIKPVPITPKKIEKVIAEKPEAREEKPAAPERKIETKKTVEVKKPEAEKKEEVVETKKTEELDAKANKEARMLALMEKYGVKNLEDLKKMGL